MPTPATSISRIKSLVFGVESTFSTCPFTDFTTGCNRLAAEGIKLEIAEDRLKRDTELPGLGRYQGLTGVKGGKLTFKLPLSSPGAVTGASTALKNTLTLLLPACGMERLESTSGSVAASPAPTATAFTITGASGLAIGMPIGLANASGELEVRYLIAVGAGNAVTVEPAFSSIPAAGAQVYTSIQLVPIDSGATVSFLMAGDAYAYLVTGCRGSFKLSGKGKERWMIEFTFVIDSWQRASIANNQCSLTINGAAHTFDLTTLPALPTDTNLLATGSRFYYDLDNPSLQDLLTSETTFDQGWTPAPITTTEGANARSGWVYTDANPTVTTKPLQSALFQPDYGAAAVKKYLWQFGHLPGQCVVLLVTGQIEKYPNEADEGGIVHHELQIAANAQATGVTSGSNGPLVAPGYALHFM